MQGRAFSGFRRNSHAGHKLVGLTHEYREATEERYFNKNANDAEHLALQEAADAVGDGVRQLGARRWSALHQRNQAVPSG
jgi:hypothetical protein